jgi:hypothetical protein
VYVCMSQWEWETIKRRIKQSNYVPGGSDSQISRKSAHEGGKIVSPRLRPPLPAGIIPDTHFC